ncbi:MAG: hypothetical protein AMXMBFR84_00300 [Candidatus Hydrogenedentota bacterium]
MFYKVAEEDDGAGCLLLLFAGLIPYMLFHRRHGRRVQCGLCGYIFAMPPLPGGLAASLAVVGLLLGLAVAAFWIVVVLVPEIEGMLPKHELAIGIALFVERHSLAFAYSIGIYFVLTFFLFLFVNARASHEYRSQMEKIYRTEPQAAFRSAESCPRPEIPASNPDE